MKNSDKPAMPMDVGNVDFSEQCLPLRGLTKREYIAALALQGCMQQHGVSLEGRARRAVSAADALLAELEKNE